MKKTIVTAVLLGTAFTALIGSCATSGKTVEKIEQVAGKFNEGDYYAYQFERYKAQYKADLRQRIAAIEEGRSSRVVHSLPDDTPRLRVLAEVTSPSLFVNPTNSRRYGEKVEKPRGVTQESPSEEDIDRAIEAYEASLALMPAGTWKTPLVKVTGRNDGALPINYRKDLMPPESGVQARLVEAQKRKHQWETVEKPPLEQQVAAARAKRQQAQNGAGASAGTTTTGTR